MSANSSKRDLLALQGRWRQIAFEQDGVEDPPDTHGAPNSITTITGNRFSVHTAEGDLILDGILIVDATVTPKSITWIDDAGPKDACTLVSSYILEGDQFVFVGAPEGDPRPTEFKTGPGQSLRRFVRG